MASRGKSATEAASPPPRANALRIVVNARANGLLLRAVRRGLDHLVEGELERLRRRLVRGAPTHADPSPHHSHRAAAEEREALVPVLRLGNRRRQRFRRRGTCPAATSVASARLGAAVEEQTRVLGFETGRGEERVGIDDGRRVHGVSEDEVGEERALRPRSLGVLGERLDGGDEAVRDVAPHHVHAVGEGRSHRRRRGGDPLVTSSGNNRRTRVATTSGIGADVSSRGGHLLILEVRVLVHQAREDVRDVLQRGWGSHAARRVGNLGEWHAIGFRNCAELYRNERSVAGLAGFQRGPVQFPRNFPLKRELDRGNEMRSVSNLIGDVVKRNDAAVPTSPTPGAPGRPDRGEGRPAGARASIARRNRARFPRCPFPSRATAGPLLVRRPRPPPGKKRSPHPSRALLARVQKAVRGERRAEHGENPTERDDEDEHADDCGDGEVRPNLRASRRRIRRRVVRLEPPPADAVRPGPRVARFLRLLISATAASFPPARLPRASDRLRAARARESPRGVLGARGLASIRGRRRRPPPRPPLRRAIVAATSPIDVIRPPRRGVDETRELARAAHPRRRRRRAGAHVAVPRERSSVRGRTGARARASPGLGEPPAVVVEVVAVAPGLTIGSSRNATARHTPRRRSRRRRRPRPARRDEVNSRGATPCSDALRRAGDGPPRRRSRRPGRRRRRGGDRVGPPRGREVASSRERSSTCAREVENAAGVVELSGRTRSRGRDPATPSSSTGAKPSSVSRADVTRRARWRVARAPKCPRPHARLAPCEGAPRSPRPRRETR